MSEREYLDVGQVNWAGAFVIGGLKNDRFNLISQSITVESSLCIPAQPSAYTHSFIQLRQYLCEKTMCGQTFQWAVLHWYGTLADMEGRIVESFLFGKLAIDRQEAIESFRGPQFTGMWSKHKCLFPKLWAARQKLDQRGATTPIVGRPIHSRENNLEAARLKVLASDWPITVDAMQNKNVDAVKAWELERQINRPSRIDAANYELALNWPEYENQTAKEIADKIADRTGIKIKPRTLEKRREALGLFTTRPTGPKPKVE